MTRVKIVFFKKVFANTLAEETCANQQIKNLTAILSRLTMTEMRKEVKMIKCESGNMSSDGTSCGYVTTDCLTVGQFVTEAVAKFSKGEITFQVDDATFTVRGKGNEAFRYDSRLKIESVEYVSGWTDDITFIVKTKPNTVRREGWVNVYSTDSVARPRLVGRNIYPTKKAADTPIDLERRVAVAHIEWEEPVK